MVELLYFIAFILVIAVVAQVVNVYGLVLVLKGGGPKDTKVTEDEGRWNGIMYVLYGLCFYGAYIWLYIRYEPSFLPVAASEHGLEIDKLLDFNFAMINIVFVILISLLFYFPVRYHFKKGRKARWYPENNKVEIILTIIPSIAMAVVIIWGLKTWNAIFSEPADNAVKIELYARQFDWTARYAGADNQLGDFNSRLIGGITALGLKPDDPKVQDSLQFPASPP